MEKIIKTLKSQPLFVNNVQATSIEFERSEIQAIIPHRSPFLLIDKIIGINLSKQLIKGDRYISKEDQVFSGHFPGMPIYPGVLQLETMAQLGLCLAYFVLNNTLVIDHTNPPIKGMITKLHHAAFNTPILPDQTLTIYNEILHYDEITGMIAGQIYHNNILCSYAIMECYFND